MKGRKKGLVICLALICVLVGVVLCPKQRNYCLEVEAIEYSIADPLFKKMHVLSVDGTLHDSVWGPDVFRGEFLVSGLFPDEGRSKMVITFDEKVGRADVVTPEGKMYTSRIYSIIQNPDESYAIICLYNHYGYAGDGLLAATIDFDTIHILCVGEISRSKAIEKVQDYYDLT